MATAKDITKKRFGKLVAINREDPHIQPNGTKKSKWLCICDCGKHKIIQQQNLTRGLTRSCGACKRDDFEEFRVFDIEGVQEINSKYKISGKGNTKHGFCSSPLLSKWRSIMGRCYNHKHYHYKYYGAKGISVCERWLDVGNFINDNKDHYRDGYSIDRINTNGDYSPENTRWIQNNKQVLNTGARKRGKVKYKGVCYDRNGRYRVNIYRNKKQTSLGVFDDPILAALEYDINAEQLWGDLAWLNRQYFQEVMEKYKELNT